MHSLFLVVGGYLVWFVNPKYFRFIYYHAFCNQINDFESQYLCNVSFLNRTRVATSVVELTPVVCFDTWKNTF